MGRVKTRPKAQRLKWIRSVRDDIPNADVYQAFVFDKDKKNLIVIYTIIRHDDTSELYVEIRPEYVNKNESARWGGCLLFGERHWRLGRVQRLAEEHFKKYIRKNETVTDRQNRPVVR